jgi:hypothetical protein
MNKVSSRILAIVAFVILLCPGSNARATGDWIIENPTIQVQEDSERTIYSAMMSYQGRLLEDGLAVSGVREMTFSLWTAVTGGTEIWDMAPINVTVSNGLFQVNLGPFDETTIRIMKTALWLEVEIDGTVLPRQRLMGAPFAFSLAPGSEVTGSTVYAMFSAHNDTGNGIMGSSVDDIGVLGTSISGSGVVGRSANAAGVFGESTSDHGLQAVGYGPGLGGAALMSTANSDSGVGILAVANSSNATIISRNNAAGALFEGYAGDDDEFVPEFVVQNNGTVQQELGASGLVKAGYLLYCANSDSEITRGFNNVIGSGPTSISNLGTGFCLLDMGFDISESYWVTSNPAPVPFFVSCDLYTDTQLWCQVFNPDGTTMVNGNIMLLFY